MKCVLAEHNIHITALADNVDDAKKELENNKFDIILIDMDILEKEHAGIEITKEISKLTDAYILILTGSCLDREIIYMAHEAGACGYELKIYIEKIPYVLKEMLYGQYTPMLYSQQAKIEKLNIEQKDIITDLKNNLTYTQIAKKNTKSYESTKKQIARIKKKIGITWKYIIGKK